MAFVALVAATTFVCMAPSHPDGDEIRCRNRPGTAKLYSIDAPKFPNQCRRGNSCVPGNPEKARDYLTSLTRGRTVTCTTVDPRSTGRKELRCTADKVDLSCAIVGSGYALERQDPLNCDAFPPVRSISQNSAKATSMIALPKQWRWYVPVFLVVANVLTYLAFASDRSRMVRGLNRIADIHLLTLVLFGGGLGALVAQQRLDHMRTEQPFATQFAILLGLQFGTVVGLVGMLLWPTTAA